MCRRGFVALVHKTIHMDAKPWSTVELTSARRTARKSDACDDASTASGGHATCATNASRAPPLEVLGLFRSHGHFKKKLLRRRCDEVKQIGVTAWMWQ